MDDGALLMMIYGSHCPYCERRAWPYHINRRGRFRHCQSRKVRKANKKAVRQIMADLARKEQADV